MNEIRFKTGRYAYWKLVVADENVELSAGKPELIPIRDINLPPKTMVAPLSIMRHALGSLIDVKMEKKRKIEEEKRLKKAVFLPIESGLVEKGDVIGVVKVYPTTIGDEEVEVKVELRKQVANIVYREKEIKRNFTEVSDGWYRRWHLAEWYPLVADEDVEVKRGVVRRIKIKSVEIPESTIPVPLSISRNAIGTVVDVISPEKPKKVEERRFISEAIFVPVHNGLVERGDLIGVMNVFYVSVGNFSSSIVRYLVKIPEANIVSIRNGVIRRKSVKLTPLTFKRSESGYILPIKAAEDKTFEERSFGLLKIDKIEISPNVILQPISGITENVCLIDLYSETPKLVEESKSIDKAIICSLRKTEIKRGETIGAVAFYNVSILVEPELFIAKYTKI
ncbi:MAG: DUF22 domain-containing protein [Archaeoglobaceae archaeon]